MQQSHLADYANDFAGGLDRMAESLRDQDISTLISQSQELARRQPALYLGGAIATGFILARFLKSSQQHSHAGGRHSDTGHYDVMAHRRDPDPDSPAPLGPIPNSATGEAAYRDN